jgi:hypothetical protein
MADGNAERIRTALYRYFDGDGKLLYVGISLSPIYRQSQHRDAAPWYERIAMMRAEWLDSRKEALIAERAAIQSERPEFNICHNRPVDISRAEMDERIDESRAALNRRVARFQPTYSIKGAAETAGIGEAHLRFAMAAGDVTYYPTGPMSVAISGWALIDLIEALQAGTVKLHRAVILDDGRRIPNPNGEWLAANHSYPSIDAWVEHVVARWAAQLEQVEQAA